MALAGLFSKNRGGEGDSGGFKRDPRKARRFFEHAQAVADTRNYDYAIECYINGLRHEPDNLDKHEALRDVALRRKVAGGKPAGLAEKFKSGGNTPVDKMLHAEMLWAKDPLNARLMRDVMKWAVEADQAEPELNLAEVAYWVGGLALEFNAQTPKPDKNLYIQLRDLFAQIQAFDKAVDACKMALRLDPNNEKLLGELKNLEAEKTMQEGGYSSGQKVEEGGFRRFVRDTQKQRELEQSDAIAKTASAVDEMIARRRAEFEEDPQDLDRLQKLVDALVAKEVDETENEAIKLLKQAWDQTGQYRYKVRIGDIQMKQLNRRIRQLKAQADQNPDDAEARKRLEEAARKRLAFELQEYQERVKNYPTDMGLRFELGKRLYQARSYDEAIGAFQQAKADPKFRAMAHEFLGSCYLHKGWYDEAIDTLEQGIEAHPVPDDRLALELRYLLMDALERSARKGQNQEQARRAREVASQILQTDINFRDIRLRVDKLRELVDQLQDKPAQQ